MRSLTCLTDNTLFLKNKIGTFMWLKGRVTGMERECNRRKKREQRSRDRGWGEKGESKREYLPPTESCSTWLQHPRVQKCKHMGHHSDPKPGAAAGKGTGSLAAGTPSGTGIPEWHAEASPTASQHLG